MTPAPNRKLVFAALSLLFLFVIGLSGAVILTNVLAAPNEQQLTASAILSDSNLNTRFWQTVTAVAAEATEGTPPVPRDCSETGVICLETPMPGDNLQVALPSASATALPYEPTLYAQRRQTLVFYTTAAGPSTYVLFYAQETALSSAYLGTPSRTPSPTPTPFVSNGTPCAFMWARQDLPEISQMAYIALNLSGRMEPELSVRVEAYGESCGAAFLAMTTDFYLIVPLDSLDDEFALAARVIGSYWALLDGLEQYWLPARFGYLDIVFRAPDGSEKRFRAMFDEIEQAAPAGDALAVIEALGGLRE
ncbi:MAG: hypothetical protein JNJ61_28865 [Anaerolineae bacterium]|nr:hypothetical protein [Anaerolineae bacterium]